MNMADFFGVDSADMFEAKEQAHGYLTGCELATKIHMQVNETFPNASKAFKEAILDALREQI